MDLDDPVFSAIDKEVSKVEDFGRMIRLSDPETISDIISKEGMMDLIRESSIAQYLTRQGVEQGLRDSILAVLEIRFDLAASHPYAARVSNVDDAQRLKALHRAAVQVSGLDAFSRVLDEEPE